MTGGLRSNRWTCICETPLFQVARSMEATLLAAIILLISAWGGPKRALAGLAVASGRRLRLELVATSTEADYVGVNLNICMSSGLPSIVSQPQSVAVKSGDTATFAVIAQGDAPLSYQWFHGGAALPGETGADLTLRSVQPGDAGSYSVAVANAAGAITSQPALLTVSTTPRTLRVVSVTGARGAEVTVPIELAAQGNENALGSALEYDPARLSQIRVPSDRSGRPSDC